MYNPTHSISDSPRYTNNIPLHQVLHPNSEFYYHYNIVVFLAEDKLFRIPACFLVPDRNVKDYEFKSIIQSAFNSPGSINKHPGTSDEHPIILPRNVTSESFRNLLMVLSGSQTMAIVADINSNLEHTPQLIDRLRSIGMRRLDTWTQSTIQTVFQRSPSQLVKEDKWDVTMVQQLVQHMQATNVMSCRDQILRSMRLVMSALGPLKEDPCLFGFTFVVVLSLGARSPIWTNDLSREDRRVLYAGNSILVHLCDHVDLEVGWLLNTTRARKVINDCLACSTYLDGWWDLTFGRCNGLNSPIPSEDIRHIARMSDYRKSIHDVIMASSRAHCPAKCPERLFAYIDEHVDSLYCAFTRKYKHLQR
ncbi:hypothetical protein B0J17DRAFT_672905 [Rhizoctonia solani]|nr:hypothetical protein B0J17DRAFT_672905 [Rhizoctonia solani]